MPICNDCSKRSRCKTYKESLNDPNKTLFGCMDKVDSKKANYKKHREYDKANTIGVYLKLNKKTDADIIAALETVSNKQGFIKRLIRQEIAKSEEG